jgi:type IV pilus assembly protein PilV
MRQLKDRFRQSGTSLVEIMVAVLVLALGMASVSALMVTNVTSTGSAQVYSQAIIHADQMADIMRANMVGYQSAVFTSDPGTTTEVCLSGNNCTPTQQAQYDATQWKAILARDLPAGQGFICTDSSPDDGQPGALACDGSGHNVIKIFWRETRNTEGLVADTDFRLLAVSVVP